MSEPESVASSNSPPRTALITGAAGQDGRLLSAILLSHGYQVVGLVRPGSNDLPARPRLHYIYADLLDPTLFEKLIPEIKPDEVYHLAAYHHSSQDALSLDCSIAGCKKMVDTNFGTCYTLALALLQCKKSPRLVFAATSQMYTALDEITEVHEDSARNPITFYGHLKGWSMELLGLLRRDHGLQVSTVILFNHESRFRRPSFVSRKISQAAAAAALGKPRPLHLLNIGARVDWSAAEDVVAGMHLVAASEILQDFVIASGSLHSVRDLLNVAFSHVGLCWQDYAEYDRDIIEPSLCGNSHRLKSLGWSPQFDFQTWVTRMVDYDLNKLALK